MTLWWKSRGLYDRTSTESRENARSSSRECRSRPALPPTTSVNCHSFWFLLFANPSFARPEPPHRVLVSIQGERSLTKKRLKMPCHLVIGIDRCMGARYTYAE